MQLDIDDILHILCEEIGGVRYKVDPSRRFITLINPITYRTLYFEKLAPAPEFTYQIEWNNPEISIWNYHRRYNVYQPDSFEEFTRFIKLLARDVKASNTCTWCKDYLLDKPTTYAFDEKGKPERIHQY